MVSTIALWAVKNWKVLTFAGAALVLVGLGWGFWSFVGGQVKAREAAEAKVAGLEQSINALEDAAKANAAKLEAANSRLDAESELAKKRLASEQERAAAAEARARKAQGSVDDLRKRLSEAPADCNCGIGTDLTDRLRDARAEREAALRPR